MLTVMPFRVHDNDVATLQGWTRSSSIRAGVAQRARIVLLSGEGMGTTAVAERLGVSRPTVILWRGHYQEGGRACPAGPAGASGLGPADRGAPRGRRLAPGSPPAAP